MDKERRELEHRMERIESLVGSLEGCADPALREQARELVDTLMEFYGTALARIIERVSSSVPSGGLAAEELAKDPVIGSALLLHDLHPSDVETRVREALEQVRPALKSHRGDVELVALNENRLSLRMTGTCNGCPSSTATFRGLIETAIRQMAPEVEGIELEGAA